MKNLKKEKEETKLFNKMVKRLMEGTLTTTENLNILTDTLNQIKKQYNMEMLDDIFEESIWNEEKEVEEYFDSFRYFNIKLLIHKHDEEYEICSVLRDIINLLHNHLLQKMIDYNQDIEIDREVLNTSLFIFEQELELGNIEYLYDYYGLEL